MIVEESSHRLSSRCPPNDNEEERSDASAEESFETVNETSSDENGAQEEGEEGTDLSCSLPLALRVLFSFNGVTLALPSTALLYVVNDRVALPVALLPTYAAVAFLPCSLRPLYAFLNGWLRPYLRRDHLLATLLLANALSIWATAWIPERGVAACFAAAVSRGVTSSWAEFLLGLVLLQHVRKCSAAPANCAPPKAAAALASQFQAQAATARNSGSLASYAAAGSFFALVQPQLNHRSASALLGLAAAVHAVGAALALATRMGANDVLPRAGGDLPCTAPDNSRCAARWNRTRRTHGGDHSYRSVASNDNKPVCDEAPAEGAALVPPSPRIALETERSIPAPSVSVDYSTSHPTSSSSSTPQTLCMVLSLQVALILLTTRQPIVDAASGGLWAALIITAIAVLLASGCYEYLTSLRWDAVHRIGLFLILRHAVPSSTYLLDIYVYTLLQEHPLVLQVLSINAMGLSTLAAWSYGRLWSRAVTAHLYVVMGVTTAVASVASLSQVAYATLAPHLDLLPQVGVIVLVQSLVTVTGEWRFLPDVVLATIGAVDAGALLPTDSRGGTHEALPHEDEDREGVPTINARGMSQTTTGKEEGEMQYGTLISCIDFGGQVGALLAAPLVAAFRVERENDWAHLDALVGCTSLLGALSLVFFVLLPGIRPPPSNSFIH